MTRREQIIDKSLEVEKEMEKREMCLNWGLITIAEWADENLDSNNPNVLKSFNIQIPSDEWYNTNKKLEIAMKCLKIYADPESYERHGLVGSSEEYIAQDALEKIRAIK